MINAVNFKGITSDPIVRLSDETINKPQAYSSTPAAASGVQGDNFNGKAPKKKGIAGKIIGTLVAIVGVAAGLAALAKTGKLKQASDALNQQWMKTALNGLETGGNWIAKNTEVVWKPISKFFNKEGNKVTKKGKKSFQLGDASKLKGKKIKISNPDKAAELKKAARAAYEASVNAAQETVQ